ncbi:murein hydrolase activator EnvC family protein [Alicyclobacillus vulcanalis]|uniref:Peptidase family M23 n=1 Tax=Alicyclobacillus vulcanalis TaxID=252246 RepID=A0A1N7KQ32_9BACL|nr:peptidoglycan DD-metalloendopeptidase family protein [Alicyclobacillus vulcanalis]SIS63719.1 Peptidase family M23 [Alicyclobacillus vulcanalis]
MPRNIRAWPRKRQEPSPATETSEVTPDACEAPSRWTTAESDPWPESPISPLGYADDDGSIRQVESAAWLHPVRMRAKASRGFQPAGAKKPGASRGTSRLTWQLFGAIVLVASGYALQHDPRIPASLAARAVDVFDVDYTSRLQSALDEVLARLHVRPVSLGVSQALQTARAPVYGRVIQGYGPNHPEVWVQGDAGDTVQAVAPGTVLGVYQTGNTYLVKVDHGAAGIALYGGLGSVAVHPDEIVLRGQELGTLPRAPAHPVFRFSVEKNGTYENPELWVSFAGGKS